MSKLCEYCTYSKQCPDIVEYDSVYCLCHRRIHIKPSFTTRKLKKLEEENQQLKEKIDKAIEWANTHDVDDCWELLEILKGGSNE